MCGWVPLVLQVLRVLKVLLRGGPASQGTAAQRSCGRAAQLCRRGSGTVYALLAPPPSAAPTARPPCAPSLELHPAQRPSRYAAHLVSAARVVGSVPVALTMSFRSACTSSSSSPRSRVACAAQCRAQRAARAQRGVAFLARRLRRPTAARRRPTPVLPPAGDALPARAPQGFQAAQVGCLASAAPPRARRQPAGLAPRLERAPAARARHRPPAPGTPSPPFSHPSPASA